MYQEYSIEYRAKNHYDSLVDDAYWQFLIIPEDNETQQLVSLEFSNSLHDVNQTSINGFGFKTIKVHPRQKFSDISFDAFFKVIKKEMNPFDFSLPHDAEMDYRRLEDLEFKVDFEPFLRRTHFTHLPEKHKNIFCFDKSKSIFENLQDLNQWVFDQVYFKVGVTDVNTTLEEIIEKRHGVCQDFTHLFCALAKANQIPTRYISGYLHQGNGYFGDSQMHAWAEAYLPHVGWIGFDPTNNLIANTNHIKVCHGKDYEDCSPLKGVVYTLGDNRTSYTVKVLGEQQQ